MGVGTTAYKKIIDLGTPNPKQALALKATKKHVCFGGARGGGKSWMIRAKAIILCCKYPGIKCLIVRRTYKEVFANHIEPLMALLAGFCRYNKSENRIIFPNGSQIICGYCDNDSDALNYRGLEYDVIFIDEATLLKETWIRQIAGSCRGVNGFPKRVYYTTNPGGPSHGYIKRLFIDRKFEQDEHPEEYVFIQSLITDNKILMEMDPDYVHTLESLPRVLKEAWLNGRWDVFEGAYFEEFRTTPDPQLCAEHHLTIEEAEKQHLFTHVIKPFSVPQSWNVYRSYDWGYGKPFSCGWYAIDFDGCMYKILELYGCTGTPNEGLKWNNDVQFKEIHRIETEHQLLRGRNILGVADPSIWDGSRGISAADTAEKYGVYFTPGINDRVPGWMQVRERLKFDENGRAMLYFFDTCKDSIRTIPLMMFDKHHIEDLDSDLEDHACDEIRYMCMSRPIKPREIVTSSKPFYDPLNQFKK